MQAGECRTRQQVGPRQWPKGHGCEPGFPQQALGGAAKRDFLEHRVDQRRHQERNGRADRPPHIDRRASQREQPGPNQRGGQKGRPELHICA